MDRKTKIKELKDRLEALNKRSGGAFTGGQKDLGGMMETLLREEGASVRKEVADRPVVKALGALAKEFSQLKKDLDFAPIIKGIEESDAENEARFKEVEDTFNERLDKVLAEIKAVEDDSVELSAAQMAKILEMLDSSQKEYALDKQNSSTREAMTTAEVSRMSQELRRIAKILGTPKKEDGTQKTLIQNIQDTKQARKVAEEAKTLIEELRSSINTRLSQLANRGGGNANRNIAVGGNTSVLSRYTDINIKAGANTTLTYTNNNTTKYLDLTIASTGGGGGTVRSINSVAVDTAAGSTAGTDYVYLVSGTTTITLPTAVGNTNLYTIKNVGSGTVTVAFTGGQTCDGSATLSLPVQYTSVDLISDTANWNVT